MATGKDVVNGAFSHLGVTTITAAELQAGIENLNDMLASWEPSMQLGFEPLKEASDILRVPRSAIGAIKACLAIFLAPGFGKPVSNAQAVMAAGMKNDLLLEKATTLEVAFPPTLPMGSGNSGTGFFPEGNSRNF